MSYGQHTPTLFVTIGFVGDLTQRKLIPGFLEVFKRYRKSGTPNQLQVLGADSRPIPENLSIKKYIETRSKVDLKNLPMGFSNFLDIFSFVQTSRENGGMNPLFEKVKNFKTEHPQGAVVFYLAVPYTVNIPFLRELNTFSKSFDCSEFRIIFEKPAEIGIEGISDIRSLLRR